MNERESLWRALRTIAAALTLMAVISACGIAPTLSGSSWKEEVQFQDGTSIIVKRSQSYTAWHEIGYHGPVKNHTITFTLPGSHTPISWTSEYDDDIRSTSFIAVALHVLHATPYIVADPAMCLSYNKWGRPNPPYVVFRYDGKTWQRIPLAELPAEFISVNLVVSGYIDGIKAAESKRGYVTAGDVKTLNESLGQPQYKSILRQPIPHGGQQGCGEMVGNGKGSWTGIGWFRDAPSLEACLQVCTRNDYSAQYCPCNTLFNDK